MCVCIYIYIYIYIYTYTYIYILFIYSDYESSCFILNVGKPLVKYEAPQATRHHSSWISFSSVTMLTACSLKNMSVHPLCILQYLLFNSDELFSPIQSILSDIMPETWLLVSSLLLFTKSAKTWISRRGVTSRLFYVVLPN